MNLESYWDAILSELLSEIEKKPGLNTEDVERFKRNLNRWRSQAERTSGERLDVASAIGLFNVGRKLLGATENPLIAAGDATAETARSIAGTTALAVGGAALVLAALVYAFTSK